jgi:hypothetical protein
MLYYRVSALAIFLFLCGETAFALGDCVPGREEQVTACSHLSTVGSWEGPRHNSATCTYNPPPGWVLVDHQVHEHSSNNGSSEVSIIAGGSNFISESDLREIYDSLGRIAGEFNSPKTGQISFSGQLENKFNWHLNEVRKFSASHNTLQAIVRASAHGNEIFDRKRGWQEISVIARLRCLGEPDAKTLKAQVASDIGMNIGAELYVRNSCTKAIRFAISYLKLNQEWDEVGFWEYDGKSNSFPGTSQGNRIRSNNDVFYFFAETLDGSLVWQGDQKETVRGRTVNMRKIELRKDSDGDYVLEFTCN